MNPGWGSFFVKGQRLPDMLGFEPWILRSLARCLDLGHSSPFDVTLRHLIKWYLEKEENAFGGSY